MISREQATEVLEAHLQVLAPAGLGFWSIRKTGDAELIGFCGLRPFEIG